MAYSSEALELSKQIESKLYRHFGRTSKNATPIQLFRACAQVIMDTMVMNYDAPSGGCKSKREVHYLSLEFLLGRSMQKNAFNLGIEPVLTEALELLGTSFSDLMETEPDAGLGNGGLGRLAACYLESMTTLGISATGYCICYEFGIFRQKILEKEQIELPDLWMDAGDVWLVPCMDEVCQVSFGGYLEFSEENGRRYCNVKDDTKVLAVPYDMAISGYKAGKNNFLRLWRAKSPVAIDMPLFIGGEYMKAIQQNATAEIINKVLYPSDDHMEGKLLRLRQQYFFVSATAQSIVVKHKARFNRLTNFHEYHAIQINDTHPALIIPELMRIFMDQEGLGWDQAWHIVTRTVDYTNHTVLSEALECWPQDIIELLLPRIWTILCEINDRYVERLWNALKDEARVSSSAIIWDGTVRMANLCVYACAAVNGVSALHTNILKEDIFRNQYFLWPNKFLSVTNGVDHRRWLAQANPRLHGLICDLTGGDGYLLHPELLEKLLPLAKKKTVLRQLGEIKSKNKKTFAQWLFKEQGVMVDPESIFDVHVKRLHEYKRQLLNVLHIMHLYNRLKDNPNMDFVPRTFFFGGKAAASYAMAKRIIRLINSLAEHIDSDHAVRDRLKVVFLENFRVSVAEKLIPASEISEQISTAGKEASGTGNMKFMMNGALTVGTMDGANVEICDLVGKENMFIFGLRTNQVSELLCAGHDPHSYYTGNPDLRRVLDQLSSGLSDGMEYKDIVDSLLVGHWGSCPDPYFLLADFEDYCQAQRLAGERYRMPDRWSAMSLANIAHSGFFASDRSIGEYAKNIWKV
ncbi:MAG: glycogen/starch/alpha-glucan phosphorylase [Oscillospiraceae bacterium]|nr:glycogen/starch/alpha-glucan phosphorylase [Oscillospiraceae bacterium]